MWRMEQHDPIRIPSVTDTHVLIVVAVVVFAHSNCNGYAMSTWTPRTHETGHSSKLLVGATLALSRLVLCQKHTCVVPGPEARVDAGDTCPHAYLNPSRDFGADLGIRMCLEAVFSMGQCP